MVSAREGMLQPQRPSSSKASAPAARPGSNGLSRKSRPVDSQQQQQPPAAFHGPTAVAVPIPGASRHSTVGHEFDVPKDQLVQDLRDSKADIRRLTDLLNHCRVEAKKAQEELAAQDARLAIVIDQSYSRGVAGIAMSEKSHKVSHNEQNVAQAAARKEKRQQLRELEKSLIIRNIKSRCALLRAEILALRAEAAAVARNSKASSLTALALERDEYMYECMRLKSLVEIYQQGMEYGMEVGMGVNGPVGFIAGTGMGSRTDKVNSSAHAVNMYGDLKINLEQAESLSPSSLVHAGSGRRDRSHNRGNADVQSQSTAARGHSAPPTSTSTSANRNAATRKMQRISASSRAVSPPHAHAHAKPTVGDALLLGPPAPKRQPMQHQASGSSPNRAKGNASAGAGSKAGSAGLNAFNPTYNPPELNLLAPQRKVKLDIDEGEGHTINLCAWGGSADGDADADGDFYESSAFAEMAFPMPISPGSADRARSAAAGRGRPRSSVGTRQPNRTAPNMGDIGATERPPSSSQSSPAHANLMLGEDSLELLNGKEELDNYNGDNSFAMFEAANGVAGEVGENETDDVVNRLFGEEEEEEDNEEESKCTSAGKKPKKLKKKKFKKVVKVKAAPAPKTAPQSKQVHKSAPPASASTASPQALTGILKGNSPHKLSAASPKDESLAAAAKPSQSKASAKTDTDTPTPASTPAPAVATVASVDAPYDDDAFEEDDETKEHHHHRHQEQGDALPKAAPAQHSGPHYHHVSHEYRQESGKHHAIEEKVEVEIVHHIDKAHHFERQEEVGLLQLENFSKRQTYICGNNTHDAASQAPFHINDRVEALYQEGQLWFPGVIVCFMEQDGITKSDVKSIPGSTAGFNFGKLVKVHFSAGETEVVPPSNVRIFKPAITAEEIGDTSKSQKADTKKSHSTFSKGYGGDSNDGTEKSGHATLDWKAHRAVNAAEMREQLKQDAKRVEEELRVKEFLASEVGPETLAAADSSTAVAATTTADIVGSAYAAAVSPSEKMKFPREKRGTVQDKDKETDKEARLAAVAAGEALVAEEARVQAQAAADAKAAADVKAAAEAENARLAAVAAEKALVAEEARLVEAKAAQEEKARAAEQEARKAKEEKEKARLAEEAEVRLAAIAAAEAAVADTDVSPAVSPSEKAKKPRKRRASIGLPKGAFDTFHDTELPSYEQATSLQSEELSDGVGGKSSRKKRKGKGSSTAGDSTSTKVPGASDNALSQYLSMLSDDDDDSIARESGGANNTKEGSNVPPSGIGAGPVRKVDILSLEDSGGGYVDDFDA